MGQTEYTLRAGAQNSMRHDGRGVAQIRDREFELIRDMMVMVVLAI